MTEHDPYPLDEAGMAQLEYKLDTDGELTPDEILKLFQRARASHWEQHIQSRAQEIAGAAEDAAYTDGYEAGEEQGWKDAMDAVPDTVHCQDCNILTVVEKPSR